MFSIHSEYLNWFPFLRPDLVNAESRILISFHLCKCAFLSTLIHSLQHVFADTLRSIAVIIAASIAEFVKGVRTDQADAVAALVVSFLIFLSLLPLMNGLICTWAELQEAIQEEVAGIELIDSRGEREIPQANAIT